MTSPSTERDVRVASAAEFGLLREIEVAADQMFGEIGIGPFASSGTDDHLDRAAVVLVSGRPAVGFACVEEVDGLAHLWQLSVLPSAAVKVGGLPSSKPRVLGQPARVTRR